MKIIKHSSELTPRPLHKKTAYIRYRVSKRKHTLWLKSRKSKENVYLTPYDNYILDKMNPGATVIYASAGYFLEDCIDDLTVIETNPVVKDFYPKAIIVKEREQLGKLFPKKFDNFIVCNNRSDYWVDIEGTCRYIEQYKKCMNDNCLFFYSLRDTQFQSWNRLKINHYEMFVNLAKAIEKKGFRCLESKMEFANGDGNENPDNTNGNIKYIFQCIR